MEADVPNMVEVNKVADEFGVPGAADGIVDQVVDEEVNKFL